MALRSGDHRIPAAWWTLVLLAVIGVFLFATTAAFKGTFRSYVPVTLTSDRAGLVLETNAKVMLRGVQVGRVGEIAPGKNMANL
ncbi:MlaD family protein, partial [Mycobacterium sp.]|uniref:MlaD family protein n=1 Tax=Mycobacterium sp. TaxID=1785 RepID=UPI003BB64CCF